MAPPSYAGPRSLRQLLDAVITVGSDLDLKTVLRHIVDTQLANVISRVAARDIALSFSLPVREHLAKVGFDPLYGARPLKRVIQKSILDPLALEILEKKVHSGERIEAVIEKKKIVFKKSTLKNQKTP